MDKVYIVTTGEYSDYHIKGVFSSEEKAQSYIDEIKTEIKQKKGVTTQDNGIALKDLEDVRIEEYPIDFLADKLQQGLRFYCVDMWEDGEIKETYNDAIGYGEGEKDYHLITSGWRKLIKNWCWAKDEQHAIKITNELRTRLIATNVFHPSNNY